MLEIMQILNCTDQSFITEDDKNFKYLQEMTKMTDVLNNSDMLKCLFYGLNPKFFDLLDQALTFNHL